MKRFRLLPLLALGCMIFPLAQADDASIVIKPRPATATVLAIPEFQPKSGNLDPSVDEYLKIVNETLWNDLEYSAFFKLLSRSFYPALRINEPEELVFKDWQDRNLRRRSPPPSGSTGETGTTGSPTRLQSALRHRRRPSAWVSAWT